MFASYRFKSPVTPPREQAMPRRLSRPEAAAAPEPGFDDSPPPALFNNMAGATRLGRSGLFSGPRDAEATPGKWMPALLFLVSVMVGVGIVALLLPSSGSKAPDKAVPTEMAATAPAPATAATPAPEPKPSPALIRFNVQSVPAGAQVAMQGKVLGKTPLEVELPAGADGTATAELALKLDGYHPMTVTAGGSGPVVVLKQKLHPKTGPKPSVARREVARAPAPAPPDDLDDEEYGEDDDEAPSSPGPRAEPASATGGSGLTVSAIAPAPAPAPAPVAPPPTATAGSAPTGALPRSDGMTKPVMLSGRDPVYTREALVAGIQGTMVVKCVVTLQGTLQNCRVLKSLPHMDQAVLDALKTRVYTPAMQDGQPVAVEQVFNLTLIPPRRR
jgi:serine/threonine-protein kinase